MTALSELRPGDEVHQDGQSAVYVAQVTHPVWPDLKLVIWRMRDGSWSHDALAPHQDVGEADVTASLAERRKRLINALRSQP